jgi:predicted DNA-binding helix-hairpin-helix protein
LKNRVHFPVDVQHGDKEMLLRVPGFGSKTVKRVLQARRWTELGFGDLLRMGAIMSNAKPFVLLKDWHPGKLADVADLRARFVPPAEQLALFQ